MNKIDVHKHNNMHDACQIYSDWNVGKIILVISIENYKRERTSGFSTDVQI